MKLLTKKHKIYITFMIPFKIVKNSWKKQVTIPYYINLNQIKRTFLHESETKLINLFFKLQILHRLVNETFREITELCRSGIVKWETFKKA